MTSIEEIRKLAQAMTPETLLVSRSDTTDRFHFSSQQLGHEFILTAREAELADEDLDLFRAVLRSKIRDAGFGMIGETQANPHRDAENELPSVDKKGPGENVPPRDFSVEQLEEFLGDGAGEERFLRVKAGTIYRLMTKVQSRAYREAEKATAARWTETVAELAPATTEEFRRAEAIELVTAMVAGASFELIRDIPGETAMWVQHLKDLRPAVQVFLQVPHATLVDSSPAQLYTFIRNQVGAA